MANYLKGAARKLSNSMAKEARKPYCGETRTRYPNNDPEDGPARLMRWEGDELGWVPVVHYNKIKKGRELIANAEADLGHLDRGQRRDLLMDNTQFHSDEVEEVERIIEEGPVYSTTFVLAKGHRAMFECIGSECVLIEYGGPLPGPSDCEMLIFI